MTENVEKKAPEVAPAVAAAPEPIKVRVDAETVVRKAVEQSKLEVGNGWIKVRWNGGTRLVLPNAVRVKFINGEAIVKAKYWPMLQEAGVEFVEIDNSGYREQS
jgi:hypothetical protein